MSKISSTANRSTHRGPTAATGRRPTSHACARSNRTSRSATLLYTSLVVLTLGAAELSAQVALGGNRHGEMSFFDLREPSVALASEAFRLKLDGVPFETSHVGGAARLPDGRLVAAMRPATTPTNDIQIGWALYDVDPARREATKITDLPAAMSALASAPNGDLVAITYKPARFVRIDPSTGALHDFGTFSIEQTSPWEYATGLIYDAPRDRFLYVAGNLPGPTFQLHAITTDGSSWSPVDHDITSTFPTGLVPWQSDLYLAYGSTARRLDLAEGPATLDELLRFRYSGYFGIHGFAPHSFLVDVTDLLPCVPGRHTLCLQEFGYEVALEWVDPNSGSVELGRTQPQSQESGFLWFTSKSNLEVQVKVLDACAVNGHRWVFGSASTDLEFELTVRETATGETRVYTSPPATAADAIADITAFDCTG